MVYFSAKDKEKIRQHWSQDKPVPPKYEDRAKLPFQQVYEIGTRVIDKAKPDAFDIVQLKSLLSAEKFYRLVEDDQMMLFRFEILAEE